MGSKNTLSNALKRLELIAGVRFLIEFGCWSYSAASLAAFIKI